MSRKRRLKIRTWAEHEALIAATERAEQLWRESGWMPDIRYLQIECDREALDKLHAQQNDKKCE